jgi:hypothetical protein
MYNLYSCKYGQFNCPICSKRTSVEDAKILEKEGKTLKYWTESHGRMVEFKKQVEIYKIRICPQCYKKMKTTRTIVLIIFHIVIPLIITIVRGWWPSFLLIQPFSLILSALTFGIIRSLNYKIDLDVAKENNAIEPVF